MRQDDGGVGAKPGSVDDEAWVRRLREVVSSGAEPEVGLRRTDALVVRTASSADVASTLRILEQRLATIEADVTEMRRRHETLVDDIAAAVVQRLDARWSAAVGDDPATA